MAEQGPFVLVTVTLPRGARLQDAMQTYGLAPEEVDASYGVVLVDPEHGTHVMMVTQDAATRITGARRSSAPATAGRTPSAASTRTAGGCAPTLPPSPRIRRSRERSGGRFGQGARARTWPASFFPPRLAWFGAGWSSRIAAHV